MLKRIFSLSLMIIINHSTITMEQRSSAIKEKSSRKKELQKSRSHSRTLIKRSSSSSSSSFSAQMAKLSPIKPPRFFRKSIKEEPSSLNNVDLSVMPTKECINQTDHHGNTNLIYAVRNKMADRVALLLQEEELDINGGNRWHMTALHYAAINKDKEIIDLLLQDPRTQASISNREGYNARELIDVIDENAADIQLRSSLFVRASLEKLVERLCESIQNTFHDEWKDKTITVDSECIEKALQKIEKAFSQNKEIEKVPSRDEEIEITDQSIPLPEEALLPDYADNNFIRTMLMLRLYNTN